MESTRYKGKSLSRTELASKYGVSAEMFNEWLRQIEHKLNLKRRRIIRPNEIQIIFQEWGEPD